MGTNVLRLNLKDGDSNAGMSLCFVSSTRAKASSSLTTSCWQPVQIGNLPNSDFKVSGTGRPNRDRDAAANRNICRIQTPKRSSMARFGPACPSGTPAISPLLEFAPPRPELQLGVPPIALNSTLAEYGESNVLQTQSDEVFLIESPLVPNSLVLRKGRQAASIICKAPRVPRGPAV